ncbi:MAG TPA: acyltransferase [Puia sp.]|nr:acyltransferase [Puia sp.]
MGEKFPYLTYVHFRKIDFLRGIAILTVFQAHFIWYYFPAYAGVVGVDAGHPASRVFLLNLLPRTIGWAGVTIFILVSGFLLHLGYLRDQERFTLRGFYSRRFWRVYPPYLLVLLIFCLFLEKGLFTTRVGWWTFVLHVFSLQNLSMRTYFSVDPTFWCLAAEVQLYVLYAIFLFGRARWGVKAMTGLTFLVSVGWQAIGMRVNGLGNLPTWANAAVSLWVIWAMGAFLGEAWHRGQGLRAALTRRDALIVAGGLAFACLLAPLNALLQYAAAIICLLLMNGFLHGKATLQAWPARLIVTIGICSFSIFLIHQPLLQPMFDLLDDHAPHYRGYRVVNGVIVSLLIFLLSYAMYRLVELPSIALGGRLRRRARSGQHTQDQKDDA